jgi:hypothetical protein
MAEFNYYRFHRRRQLLKTVGLVLTIAGFCTILDMAWRVPIPLTGSKAVLVGLVLMGFGVAAIYNGYKLPVAEAIEILHQRNNGITASELIHLMRVDRVTADRIIAVLLEKGFLKSSAKRNDTEEVFDVVK